MKAINAIVSADCIPGNDDYYLEVEERIAKYEGLLFLGPMQKIDSNLMDKGENLKIISNYGVGYDKIDAKAARNRGIVVTNTPHSVTAPTADLAMGLMIGLSRRIVASDRAIRRGMLKSWYNTPFPSISLQNKTLGIIGMGRIGKAVAQRAKVFGMKIIYYQRNRLSATEEAQYDSLYVSLIELLKQSDILSPHIPLNDSTKKLLGASELALLKPTAFIVNTARGGIFDQQALIKLLKNNAIAGAALDVFDGEPQVPETLKHLENVILTPHIGTAPKEARSEMFEEAIANLSDFFRGKPLKNRVV